MSNPKDYREKENPTAYPDAVCAQAEARPTTLVEQLKSERSRVSKLLTSRIKELDIQIRRLEDTEAEQTIKDAERVLYKGI